MGEVTEAVLEHGDGLAPRYGAAAWNPRLFTGMTLASFLELPGFGRPKAVDREGHRPARSEVMPVAAGALQHDLQDATYRTAPVLHRSAASIWACVACFCSSWASVSGPIIP